MKVAYQGGKGPTFVPCLIPEECVKPLRRLASPETRADAGVHPENMFLYPLTKNSKDPVNGWYCIKKYVKMQTCQMH